MNVNRVVHIRDGHIVQSLQGFLAAWWKEIGLDAMLAPLETAQHGAAAPRVITRPAELTQVNPFTPVMLSNTAPAVQDFVRDHPHSQLAVMLRPCELRALVELRKRGRVHYTAVDGARSRERLIVIGVDCPGTFTQETFAQHLAHHQPDAEMIHVQVSYGRQDSYLPYEVRPTCQMCDTPAPLGADMTIGTIGVEPDGDLLILAPSERVDAALHLQAVTDESATERQVVHREMMVGKLVDTRTAAREALMRSETWQMEDLTSILALFARCKLCADCLDACPLYDGELAGLLGVDRSRRGPSLLAEVVSVSRWLASCSGCGMCMQSCTNGVPRGQLVTVLSHRIQKQLHYRPGDPSQPLPWSI